MKKIVSVLLVLALCCAFLTAGAVEAEYSNAKKFLKYLDGIGIKYTVLGVDDSYEQIKIANTDSDIDVSYNINLLFSDDNELVSIRVWNLIDFSASNLTKAYRICNGLNYDYRYTKFYVDETDNSITVSYDVICREDDTMTDLVWEGIIHVVNIIAKGYPDIAVLK